MKIISIFAGCLYAIQYHNEAQNELKRLLDLWNDVEYLFDFVHKNNINDKQKFIEEINEDAKRLDDFLNDINMSKENFGVYFENLSLIEPIILPFQKGKKIRNKKSKLRLYAIKIDKNVFLITGGAIKTTQTMQEHPDTNKELQKLKDVKRYLQQEEIQCEDDFYHFIA